MTRLLATLLSLALAAPAAAVTGFHLNSNGLPLVYANQVVECPNDIEEGRYITSWKSGNKRTKGWCEGGLASHTWKHWHENGELEYRAEFEAGELTDTFKSWWDNGEIRARGEYADGVAHGWFKFWHDNGELAEQGEYAKGEPTGCWKGWYEDGDNRYRGAYVDGDKVEKWLHWTKQGTKRKEVHGGEAAQGSCGWF